jgi:hypothetical protein
VANGASRGRSCCSDARDRKFRERVVRCERCTTSRIFRRCTGGAGIFRETGALQRNAPLTLAFF